MSLVLYNSPDSCGIIIRYTLERLGLSYADHVIDRAQREHKKDVYLKLNPQGLMPVLKDGSLVMYETGAILLYLADKHPESKIFPGYQSAERAEALKWLFFITSALHADLRIYWYAGQYCAHQNNVPDIRSQMIARALKSFRWIEEYMGSLTHDFIGGQSPGILDYYLAHMVRGAVLYPIDQQDFDPEWAEFPAIRKWAALMQERPEILQAAKKEFIPTPILLTPERPDIDPARLVG